VAHGSLALVLLLLRRTATGGSVVPRGREPADEPEQEHDGAGDGAGP